MTYRTTDWKGETLLIKSSESCGEIVLTIIGEAEVRIASEKAPEFALAALEAAGYNADNPFITEGMAILGLKSLVDRLERAEAARLAEEKAEADRNALEAEAQRLYEAYQGGAGLVGAWDIVGEGYRQTWRDVARAARRIRQDGAA